MTASVQDGAFAWLLCAACFFNITLLGGYILTSGLFYIMFKNSLDATDSQVSMIPAINIGLTHLMCLFSGMLSDKFGARCVSVTGTLLSTAGVVCGAFSTKVYHLYIAFGFIGGVGQGMVMNCSCTVLAPYFKKYKRTACSLAYTGFGVGSIIFPPILNFFENIYGWRGAMVMLGGMNIHMMLASALFKTFKYDTPKNCEALLKENAMFSDIKQPSTDTSKINMDGNADRPIKRKSLQHDVVRIFSLFKIIPFFCTVALALVYVFPMMIVLTHYGNYVLSLGFSTGDVVGLYTAFGISTTLSRPLTGIIAQASNANIPAFIMVTLLLLGILTLFVPFISEMWMLYVYAVLFQMLMTPSHILGNVIVMEHVPEAEVAVGVGMFLAFCVPGFLLGPPIAVWLYDCTKVYAHSFFLAGGITILAALTMAPAAYHIRKQRLKPQSVK